MKNRLINKADKGTIRVVELCRTKGLKDPVGKDTIDGVTPTFNAPTALAAKKDVVNDGVRVEIIKIVELIIAKEGTNALDIATKRGKSKPTIERHLRITRGTHNFQFQTKQRLNLPIYKKLMRIRIN